MLAALLMLLGCNSDTDTGSGPASEALVVIPLVTTEGSVTQGQC